MGVEAAGENPAERTCLPRNRRPREEPTALDPGWPGRTEDAGLERAHRLHESLRREEGPAANTAGRGRREVRQARAQGLLLLRKWTSLLLRGKPSAMQDKSRTKPYRRAPIEEAVVEVLFSDTTYWDPTLPGKVHEELKDAYPETPRLQHIVQAHLQAHEGRPPEFSAQHVPSRTQLVGASGRQIMSMGPNIFSVNMLRPYQGWFTFQQQLDRAFGVYRAFTRASEVRRIGLRYISKIHIDKKIECLNDFFLCAFQPPSTMPGNLADAWCQARFSIEPHSKLMCTFGRWPGSNLLLFFSISTWPTSISFQPTPQKCWRPPSTCTTISSRLSRAASPIG